MDPQGADPTARQSFSVDGDHVPDRRVLAGHGKRRE